jgi:hypothetical protein
VPELFVLLESEKQSRSESIDVRCFKTSVVRRHLRRSALEGRLDENFGPEFWSLLYREDFA